MSELVIPLGTSDGRVERLKVALMRRRREQHAWLQSIAGVPLSVECGNGAIQPENPLSPSFTGRGRG